ncbi:MAG: RNA-binding S4 domain-containing protein [Oscillospiraceae bacterium]
MKKITAKLAEKETKQIKITTPFIRLDAALKLADAVQSGGHAKLVISENDVKVNSEICIQRGKKLHKGDNFEFNNIIYEVID